MTSDPIAELKKDLDLRQAELNRLTKLKEKYPDLTQNINRWKTVRWCSKSFNGLVNDYEYRHNCGCCNDSPLEIWPYLETENGRVYSDPACFRVGQLDWHGHDQFYPNWQKSMIDAGIATSVIERLAKLDIPREDVDEDDAPCLGGLPG
jgi:hypothetical protein